MHDFKQLDLPALVDMLAFHTARYMTILSEGGTMEEYQTLKLIIHYLQKEIEIRKKELETGEHPPEPEFKD